MSLSNCYLVNKQEFVLHFFELPQQIFLKVVEGAFEIRFCGFFPQMEGGGVKPGKCSLKIFILRGNCVFEMNLLDQGAS